MESGSKVRTALTFDLTLVPSMGTGAHATSAANPSPGRSALSRAAVPQAVESHRSNDDDSRDDLFDPIG